MNLARLCESFNFSGSFESPLDEKPITRKHHCLQTTCLRQAEDVVCDAACPPPGGRPYHIPHLSRFDGMSSASNGECFDKAVIIRPRAPPPGRQTQKGWTLRWGSQLHSQLPPPTGRAFDWGNTCPPQGGTKKKTRRQRIACPTRLPSPAAMQIFSSHHTNRTNRLQTVIQTVHGA